MNADYIPLKDFNPDDSIQKWWNAKCRRPVRKSHQYGEDDEVEDDEPDDESCTNMFDGWDEFAYD